MRHIKFWSTAWVWAENCKLQNYNSINKINEDIQTSLIWTHTSLLAQSLAISFWNKCIFPWSVRVAKQKWIRKYADQAMHSSKCMPRKDQLYTIFKQKRKRAHRKGGVCQFFILRFWFDSFSFNFKWKSIVPKTYAHLIIQPQMYKYECEYECGATKIWKWTMHIPHCIGHNNSSLKKIYVDAKNYCFFVIDECHGKI